MPKVISLQSTEQYQWGQSGIGWFLKKSEDITIVEERIAPGVREVRHYHEVAWQFFYILEGSAVIEVDGQEYMLGRYDGIEIDAGEIHQLCNRGTEYVRFLLVSRPNSFNDRVEME